MFSYHIEPVVHTFRRQVVVVTKFNKETSDIFGPHVASPAS